MCIFIFSSLSRWQPGMLRCLHLPALPFAPSAAPGGTGLGVPRAPGRAELSAQSALRPLRCCGSCCHLGFKVLRGTGEGLRCLQGF